MLKSLLQKGIIGETFTENEAKEMMDLIMGGEASASQIASLLTLLRFRGETVDEMTGFAASMRNHVLKIEGDLGKVVDTCGTGGDGASTFNISTAAAIVMSAMGVKVAKHGNRAFSSKSGSADVLEFLGIPVQSTPEQAAEALQKRGMCFLFAPMYHVAMKHAVNPRKEIGFRTIFNILGPLSNPAGSRHQLIGVFDKELAYRMAETLKRLGTDKALFVTGEDGIDECSITTHTNVIELNRGSIQEYTIEPEDVGLVKGDISHIQVGSVAESGELIEAILRGTANNTAKNIVAFNAGAGLYVGGQAKTIKEGVETAKSALNSGAVYDHFQQMRQMEGEKHYA
jgi:anthranilate phosphoribosyltransferase